MRSSASKGLLLLASAALALSLALGMAQAHAQSKEVQGTIASYKAKLVTISVSSANLPPVGAIGKLSKFFQTSLGSFKTSGWLEIATVKVKASGKALVLSITEEKSQMKVNNKPVNHFKAGTKVKLVWE